MHVTVNRRETQKGMVFKKTLYWVDCTIVFSEEEKAIIKKAQLTDNYAMLYKVFMGDGIYADHGTTFKEFLTGKPQGRAFFSVGEANDWERDLRERQVHAMKDVIEGERGPTSRGPSAFEL